VDSSGSWSQRISPLGLVGVVTTDYFSNRILSSVSFVSPERMMLRIYRKRSLAGWTTSTANV
jgi:hypothetical protein